jgi:hypothetical protein
VGHPFKPMEEDTDPGSPRGSAVLHMDCGAVTYELLRGGHSPCSTGADRRNGGKMKDGPMAFFRPAARKDPAMRIRTTAHLGLLALVLGTGACMKDETEGAYGSSSLWSAQRLVLPAGTTLAVRLASRLHSQIAAPGDSWTGSLVLPVLVDRRTVLPAGTWVHGNVIDARKPGGAGGAMLDLEITSVFVGGQDVRLDASADEVLADPPNDAIVAVASASPRGAALVLQPGTVMTFTIEESVAVRYER